jgi:hypothetical protein
MRRTRNRGVRANHLFGCSAPYKDSEASPKLSLIASNQKVFGRSANRRIELSRLLGREYRPIMELTASVAALEHDDRRSAIVDDAERSDLVELTARGPTHRTQRAERENTEIRPTHHPNGTDHMCRIGAETAEIERLSSALTLALPKPRPSIPAQRQIARSGADTRRAFLPGSPRVRGGGGVRRPCRRW